MTISDDASFAEFVAQRQRPLLRFAMVLTGDAGLAEDIVAEVLARAYQRWDRVGGVNDPGTWFDATTAVPR